MSSSLRTRLFAAILLLPLVALAVETSGVGLRCRITGVVLDACCCGQDGEAAQAEVVASVSPAQCCDRVVRDAARAPTELTAKLRPLSSPPAAQIVAVLEVSSVELAAAPIMSRADARDSIGPPTVRSRLVSKRSFLI